MRRVKQNQYKAGEKAKKKEVGKNDESWVPTSYIKL